MTLIYTLAENIVCILVIDLVMVLVRSSEI